MNGENRDQRSYVELAEKSCVVCGEPTLSKSAEEYSIHSVSLDGDEFGIVGASPTIKLGTRPANIL